MKESEPRTEVEMRKKVFVSGCFDMLHSGHMAFLEEASTYGDLYVAVGSDKTYEELKGQKPMFNEEERLYMIKSIKYVKDAFISRGSGLLDYEEEFFRIAPQIFVVNEDGANPAKSNLCDKLATKYIVLKRVPKEGLPERSTTQIKQLLTQT